MAQDKVGALIVLKNKQSLSAYEDTGEKVDGLLSARLIENLFFKNSPLHDGALFISEGRVECAGCILPVSRNMDIPKHYGLRHRAALGLSEVTDAVCLVVSEETGQIAVTKGNTIRTISLPELKSVISDNLN